MKKYNIEVTEKEMLMILQARQEEREIEEVKREKNLLRKYFFNKWALIDFRTAFIREITKLIVTIYILNKFLAK